MTLYDWYLIINGATFEALDIPSREVEVVLEAVGLKTIMVVKGVNTSIVYEGVLLTPGLTGEPLFAFDGYAAYRDENDDIYLGIEVPA